MERSRLTPVRLFFSVRTVKGSRVCVWGIQGHVPTPGQSVVDGVAITPLVAFAAAQTSPRMIDYQLEKMINPCSMNTQLHNISTK